jgi:hypothetical protein
VPWTTSSIFFLEGLFVYVKSSSGIAKNSLKRNLLDIDIKPTSEVLELPIDFSIGLPPAFQYTDISSKEKAEP